MSLYRRFLKGWNILPQERRVEEDLIDENIKQTISQRRGPWLRPFSSPPMR
jgi:hypothetical protein